MEFEKFSTLKPHWIATTRFILHSRVRECVRKPRYSNNALHHHIRVLYSKIYPSKSRISARVGLNFEKKLSASSWRQIVADCEESRANGRKRSTHGEHPVIPVAGVHVSGNRSNDRKMHWSWFSTGSPGRIGRGSLLNHLAAREEAEGKGRRRERSIFAMEIEIVLVCKPHWNVLPAEMATARARALLGTLGVVRDTCVDFPTRSMYQLGPPGTWPITEKRASL